MFQTLEEVESFLNERKKYGIKPGLQRMEKLIQELDVTNAPPIVHVAGTNGKGSTIQFIQEGLLATNIPVGVFTSPSLTDVCGHFFIDGKKSEAKDIVQAMNELVPIINNLDKQRIFATEFEIITALALHYFNDRVSLLIVETGMGGRYDTTNVIQPTISVITNVSLDHEDYLGSTRKEIAYHKSGIIKKNVPVVVGNVDSQSEQVIRLEAKKKDAPIYLLHDHFSWQEINVNRMVVSLLDEKLPPFSLCAKGVYQQDNVAVSCMVLYLLKEYGFSFSWETVIRKLSKTVIPGRFEVVRKDPLIILDSAHNIDGIKSVIQTVQRLYPNKNVHVLTAIFKDKRYEEMLKLLQSAFCTVTLTTFPHERALDKNALLEISQKLNERVIFNYQEALNEVTKEKDPNELHLITGSFHFIRLVRQALLQNSS